MANIYVYSGAAGAGTGADWANAYTTLAAALTAKAAGDDFWVAHDHAESTAGTITLTSPGTAANPCRIVCVNRGGSVPPVSADLRTTATVSATGNISVNFAGVAYSRGVSYFAGSAASAGIIAFTGTAPYWTFESGGLTLNNTSTASQFRPAAAGGRCDLINTTVSFGHVNQTIRLQGGVFTWRDTSSAIGGTLPTSLITGNTGTNVFISGVDLSALGSGKNLVSFVANATYPIHFENCKLGSSVSITTGSITGPGGASVRLVNCDSADTNYRYYRETYQGTITHETTVVRTGGATDGTTPISRKMVSTANSKFYSPLESDPILFWNETTGSSVTATVEIVNDGTTFTDAEIWLEVEYLGTSGFPVSSFASDRAADILATGANQTTSTEAWTTTGLASPVKQKLSVTFTPQEVGWVKAKVCLAKPSTTLYFDPLILADSPRQLMLPEGAYINESVPTGSGGGGKILRSSIIEGIGVL